MPTIGEDEREAREGTTLRIYLLLYLPTLRRGRTSTVSTGGWRIPRMREKMLKSATATTNIVINSAGGLTDRPTEQTTVPVNQASRVRSAIPRGFLRSQRNEGRKLRNGKWN